MFFLVINWLEFLILKYLEPEKKDFLFIPLLFKIL